MKDVVTPRPPSPSSVERPLLLQDDDSRQNSSSFFEKHGDDLDDDSEQRRWDVENPRGVGGSVSVAVKGSERRKISPWIVIPLWLCLSGGIILFNKYLFSHLGFAFPVFLTAYHMLVATIGTQILRHTTHLLDSVETTPLTQQTFIRAILPIGLLYALSLVLSNAAYVMLSVGLVQMLKAFIPVVVHLISTACGLATLDLRMSCILTVITVGCVIAATGEVRYNVPGLVCQISAVIVESARLVLVQVLLHDRKMNPLVSLYYFAPVCLVFISIALPFKEGLAPFYALPQLGFGILLANGLLAFSLNLAGLFLIDSAGSLVLTLSGVSKDIILITLSVAMMGAVITGTQVAGYGLALCGLLSFKLGGKGSGKESQAGWWSEVKLPRLALLGSGVAAVLLLAGGLFSAGSWSNGRTSSNSLMATREALSAVRFPIDFSGHGSSDFLRGDALSAWKFDSTRSSIPDYSPTPDPRTLPRLAWVLVIDAGHIHQYAETIQAIECFCLKRGIAFYVDYKLHDTGHHFFTARQVNIAKYLRYHQWVFATDADMLIADSMADVYRFIDDGDRYDVDVIVADRSGGEVCACAFFIANRPGGWRFLQRWHRWADGRKAIPNWDNGDLVELFAAGMDAEHPTHTQSGWGRTSDEAIRAALADDSDVPACVNYDTSGNYGKFVQCVAQRYFEGPRKADPRARYWDAELFSWSDLPTRARAYKRFGGLTRENPMRTDVGTPKGYMPGDFLYHALKDDTPFDGNAVMCTGEEWRYQPELSFDSMAEQLVRYGLSSDYFGCFDADGRDTCLEVVQSKI